MIGRMRTFAIRLVLLLALTSVAAAPALAWTPFEFESSGRYEYHVKRIQYSYWDDAAEASEYFYTIEVGQTDAVSSDGERLFELTIANRRQVTESQLRDALSLGAFSFDNALMFGGLFESSFIVNALPEMEFEVGERISIFGMGRVLIADEETVAGRTGLLVRFEAGDAGNRQVSLEWTIDQELALPLVVRQYDDQGRLILETTLVEYEQL